MASRFTSGTGLKKVRGLGSAKSGVHHWWLQRVTAVGNFVLALWFLVSLLLLPALDYATVISWIAQPLVAVPLALLVISVFWHFRLGVQVMIEDYVHDGGLRTLSLIALTFYTVLTAATALFAIVKIALGA
ncbi:MAG: succinate dehydrogenase, hydrophobic membrane anchor protein [Sphingomonadaceae bacterium]